MFFLGKAFQVRGKAHGDEEKPFLEHLEELRIMITKIVVTLLVFTIGCWVFNKTIIDTLSEPLHELWEDREKDKLPSEITVDQWESVKKTYTLAGQLEPSQRPSFYAAFKDEKLENRCEAYGYYQLAEALPDEKSRKAWIEQLPEVSDAQRKLALTFLEKKPNPEVGAKSKVTEMLALKTNGDVHVGVQDFILCWYSVVVPAAPLLHPSVCASWPKE